LVTDDPRELADRFEARGYRRTHVRPKALTAFFPPTHRAWLKDRLAAVGLSPTPANTDARPLAYVLRLIWWEKMTGSPWLSGLLSAALKAGSWAPWAGLLAVGPLLFLVFRPVPPVRRAAWIMGYTGAAAMGLNLFLLFLYQNRYGVLYRDLGLLSALFMAGLTAGSFLGRGLAARKGALGGLMAGTEGLFVLAALGTAWSGGRYVPGLIPGLVVLTGLAGGTQFALLFAYGLSDPDRPSITEVLSRLEAADHGGAVIGALVAGLVAAPVVGLTAGSLYLAGLKAVGMLVLIRSNVFGRGFR
jgi:hypothetical protein